MVLLGVFALAARPEDASWTDLTRALAWKAPFDPWRMAALAQPDPANERQLVPLPGQGVLVDRDGRAHDLVSVKSFGDVEFHCEFLLPKRSNSGVKFEALYEIQLADSWGVERPSAADLGGIYPRAELLPTYHHIDKGFPPRVNAARPPGEWQSLDVIFQPARVDPDGRKTRDARFVKVVLNGQVIHSDQRVPTPTGHNWRRREPASGPILLQGDHGPVAFRNVRARPWDESRSLAPVPVGRR
jgi:hypothetical protein